MKPLRALVLPAALLAAAQVWHAVTPANNVDPTSGKPIEGGFVGLIGGLLLLLGCIAASIAARQGKEWARPLSLVCGIGVALGFVLYHATTLRSPVTNPYFGVDGIGPVQLGARVRLHRHRRVAGLDSVAAEGTLNRSRVVTTLGAVIALGEHNCAKTGAGDRGRTGNLNLGRVAL